MIRPSVRVVVRVLAWVGKLAVVMTAMLIKPGAATAAAKHRDNHNSPRLIRRSGDGETRTIVVGARKRIPKKKKKVELY